MIRFTLCLPFLAIIATFAEGAFRWPPAESARLSEATVVHMQVLAKARERKARKPKAARTPQVLDRLAARR